MSRVGLTTCEHVRVWAALAPDGELAEFELRALRSHVQRCGSCARFAHSIEELSFLLRSEQLEQPSFSPMIPHIVRRRHAFVARARPVTAAAAVALMALGIASRAPLEMDGDSVDRTTTAAASTAASERQSESLRAWRHGALLQVSEEPLVRMMPIGRNQPV